MTKKSWRTTLLGALTIAAGVIHAAMQYLQGAAPNLGELSAAVAAGVGLIHAKDAAND